MIKDMLFFKKVYIELKWAVIFTITILLWILFEKTLDWYEEGIADQYWLALLFAPFAVLIYLLALREKRRRVYNRKMTWLQGFVSGVILTIFIALISPLAQYITYNFITLEYFNTVTDHSVTVDLMQRTKANNYLNINGYLWQSVLGVLELGIPTAGITAIFVRKK